MLALFLAFAAVAAAVAAESPSGAVQQISPPLEGNVPDIDPIALYGGDIIFDIYRKKSRVGEQRMSFRRDGDRLLVTAHFHLAVKVLFIEAYSFDYEASEIWRDGKLIGLSATVDDDGKGANTTARVDGDLFRIEGPSGAILTSSWVFPSNHWHRGQVSAKTIINTLTGKLAQINVLSRGIDRIDTGGGPVDAEHFEYTGDLHDTEVWYDREGRWVKMTFKAGDGSRIEYRCRQCGTGTGAVAADMDDESEDARQQARTGAGKKK